MVTNFDITLLSNVIHFHLCVLTSLHLVNLILWLVILSLLFVLCCIGFHFNFLFYISTILQHIMYGSMTEKTHQNAFLALYEAKTRAFQLSLVIWVQLREE